jgi:Fe-S cluster assembly protein SufD
MSATQQIESVVDHYLAEYARVEDRLPGSADSKRTRAAELRRFADAGFPSTRQEDWKYTSLQPVTKRPFEISDAAEPIALDELRAFIPTDLDTYRLVLVDGRFNAALSDLGGLPEGVTVRAFADYLAEHDGATVKASEIDQEPGSLAAMNAAFCTDGAYIETQAGAVVDKPVHVISVASGRQDGRMTQVRHRYRLGENSQATFIEHSVGLGNKAYFANQVTEAVLGRNAQLTRLRIQQEADRGYHISSFFAQQRRDSRVFNHSFDLGGRLARIDTNSRLVDQNSEIHLYGVYAPTGRQHIDNHTRIDHATEHSISREFYRGVLDGHGHGVFNGKVVIHRDAQKTDSDQSSDALLLSDNAEVDAKPELEIYADDVAATHGSTVGQLDDDAVFYLKSRGVDEQGARAILTYSFVNAQVQKMNMPAVERFIESALLVKMPGGEDYADLA